MKLFSIPFALAALIISAFAFAAGPTATVDWTHPTANTDGSPLALTDIKETLITWTAQGATIGSVRVAAPSHTVTIPNLACGDFTFTAVTIIKTNDLASESSLPTNYATGITCKPNPPSGLTVH